MMRISRHPITDVARVTRCLGTPASRGPVVGRDQQSLHTERIARVIDIMVF